MTGSPLYFSLILVGWIITVMAEDPLLRINSQLQDEASVFYYANCLLDKGPCTGDGLAMKSTAIASENKKYSNAYDDLDIDAILKDDVERDRYYACFMDTAPCHTDAAVFFKSKTPEAIITSCKYCTTKQSEMLEKIVSWFVQNRPQDWNILMEKAIQDAKKKGEQV